MSKICTCELCAPTKSEREISDLKDLLKEAGEALEIIYGDACKLNSHFGLNGAALKYLNDIADKSFRVLSKIRGKL